MNEGFTLTELAVIVTLALILAGIALPMMDNAQMEARVIATANAGRNIHQSIVAHSVPPLYGPFDEHFPNSMRPERAFETSTEYFVYLVTNRVMNIRWHYFAPPGIPPAETQEDFDSEHNGWCIVDNAYDNPETTPFLFTSNLLIRKLKRPDLSADLSGPPFYEWGLALITRGGAAIAITGDDIQIQERFDNVFFPLDADQQALNNRILRP